MKTALVVKGKGRKVLKLKELLVLYYLRPENINPKKGCLTTDEIGNAYYDMNALSKKKTKHLYTCDSCMTEYMLLKRDMEDIRHIKNIKVPASISRITKQKLQEHIKKCCK